MNKFSWVAHNEGLKSIAESKMLLARVNLHGMAEPRECKWMHTIMSCSTLLKIWVDAFYLHLRPPQVGGDQFSALVLYLLASLEQLCHKSSEFTCFRPCFCHEWRNLWGVHAGIPYGSVNLVYGVSQDESQARRAFPNSHALTWWL
jgi:hypothetical protein